jgi:hypothetical protein
MKKYPDASLHACISELLHYCESIDVVGLQDHDVYKRRLDQFGSVIPDSVEKHSVGPEQDDKLLHKGNDTECGSCYGAAPEEECCNSCDEVLSLTSAPSCLRDPSGCVKVLMMSHSLAGSCGLSTKGVGLHGSAADITMC